MPNQVTVLITDDEPALRLTLKAYLEDCDYRVVEAADGLEGLEVFAREKPDVVVTDLRMPRMDGLGFITSLQSMSPDTPVIVITGAGDVSLTHEAVRLGAAACLTKPFASMRELVTTIREVQALDT